MHAYVCVLLPVLMLNITPPRCAKHTNHTHEPRSSSNIDVRAGPVSISFFRGATTNLCYNAVDRHVAAGHGDRVAFHWCVC